MKKFTRIVLSIISMMMFVALFTSSLEAQSKSKVLQFSWAQTLPGAEESPLGGWRLYKATTSGGPYSLEMTISYTGTPSQEYQANAPITAPDNAVTTYYFVLTAFKTDTAIPESTYSNEVSAVIDFQAPPTPSTLSVTVSGLSATISWTASAGAIGYKLYVSQTSGFIPDASTLIYDGPNTSFVFGGQSGKTYYVKLAAYDGGGNQSPFQDGVVQIQAAPSIPVGLKVIILPQ